MDRFDAVVAAAVGGLSGQKDYTLPEIASAAVKIATLVEHELAHLKELQRSEESARARKAILEEYGVHEDDEQQ